MRYVVLLMVWVWVMSPMYGEEAFAFEEVAPTFCNTMADEKKVIEHAIKTFGNTFFVGGRPPRVRTDISVEEKATLQAEYDQKGIETLKNIRTLARYREEAILAEFKPAGEEFTRCCVLTCADMPKNKDAYYFYGK